MRLSLRTTAAGSAFLVAASGAALAAVPSACAASMATIRIASTAAPVTDSSGTTWSARTGFTGGTRATNVGASYDIAGTSDDALYRTETYGMTAFHQAVPAGTYDVTLKMAENRWTAAGQRVFSVSAEGRSVLPGLDIAKAVGPHRAYDRSFTVAVTDGSLDLGFTATVNKPLVNGIRIKQVTTSTTVAPLPDTTAPETTITSSSASWAGTTGTATAAFSATEAGTAKCRVDSGSWGACTSPVSFPGLALGSHVVQVAATDAAGNTDATPASATVTVREDHDGYVRPGPGNTGVPAGTVLTRHDGDLIVTTAGATYSGLDIHGFVQIKAPNVTIKNSIIRGGVATGNRGLVEDTSSAGTGFVLQDSELVPEHPSVWLDGMKGANYTLLRNDIHGGVDGAKVYGNDVRIESNWIHDEQWYASDPNQGGGPTHNDGVQVLGGSNIRIYGNDISGAKNAALMVTQDFSATKDLVFNDNWADGGNCTVNLAHKKLASMSGLTVSHNRFGHGSALNCPVLASTMTTVTTEDDLYVDTLAPVLVRHNGGA